MQKHRRPRLAMSERVSNRVKPGKENTRKSLNSVDLRASGALLSTPAFLKEAETATKSTQTVATSDNKGVEVAEVLAKAKSHRLALESRLEELSAANARLQEELVLSLQECQALRQTLSGPRSKSSSKESKNEETKGVKVYRLKTSIREDAQVEEEGVSLLDYMQ